MMLRRLVEIQARMLVRSVVSWRLDMSPHP